MKENSISQSAFLSPRVFLVLIFLLTGVSVELVGFAKSKIDETRAISLGVVDLHTFDGAPPPCAPPPVGMVAWWPGDGNANDIIGRNNGTLQNGASFAPGEVQQAFSLDGIDDRVDVPDNANLNPGTGSFTADAWVFKTHLQADMATAPVITKHVLDFSNGYRLLAGGGKVPPSNEIDATVEDTNGNRIDVATGVDVSLNTWTHLAMTFDGSTKTLNVYEDGVLIGTGSNSQVGSISPSGQIFRIGSYNRTSLNRIETFPGLIDEVEYFNRALSQPEIQSIVNAGSSGKCKPGVRIPPTPRPRPTPAPRPTP